jgi:hypothetical protein
VVRAGVVRLLELELVRGRSVEADVRRQERGSARELADDRAERGALAAGPRKAGVDLAEEVVVLHRLHAAQQREPVHDLCLHRHQFGEPHAGELRVDRLERPADLVRRVGLRVPHVDVARPAVEDDVDDRLGSRGRLRRAGLVAEEPRQRDARDAQPADADELPAVDVPDAEQGDTSANAKVGGGD